MRQRPHFDAIHRAWLHAEIAARAFADDDCVHQFGGADDRIDRAGLDAFGAADAFVFADVGNRARRWRVEIRRQYVAVQQLRQRLNRALAAGRAAVDGFAVADGFGVGPAAGITALA